LSLMETFLWFLYTGRCVAVHALVIPDLLKQAEVFDFPEFGTCSGLPIGSVCCRLSFGGCWDAESELLYALHALLTPVTAFQVWQAAAFHKIESVESICVDFTCRSARHF
jgi:hypothetical protein